MSTRLRVLTEGQLLELERELVEKGLRAEDPAGYCAGYRRDAQGIHWKRYYRGERGQLWVLEQHTLEGRTYTAERLK